MQCVQVFKIKTVNFAFNNMKAKYNNKLAFTGALSMNKIPLDDCCIGCHSNF